MRIACPGCQAEFNIDDSRIPAGGLHLKCPKCAALFAVKKDAAAAARPPAPAAPGPVPLPAFPPGMVPPVPAAPAGAPGAMPPPGPPPGIPNVAAKAPPAGPPPGIPNVVAKAPPAGPPPGVRPPAFGAGAMAPPVPLPGSGAPAVPIGAIPLQPVPGAVPVPLPTLTPNPSAPPNVAAPVPLPRPPAPPSDPLDDFSLSPGPRAETPFDFDAAKSTVILPAPPPPPKPLDLGEGFDPAPASAPTRSTAFEGGAEFDPSASAGPRPPPPAAAPSFPAPAPTDPDLELLDFVDGAAPRPETTPPPLPPDEFGTGDVERFTIRRKSGKIFGPFESHTVVKMLSEGQLVGNEEVAVDGATFQPIGAVPAFARAIEELMEAPGGVVQGLDAGKRPEPPTLFGGRMAAPAVQDSPGVAGGLVARLAGIRERLPATLRGRLKPIGIGAAVALFVAIGLVLELATPYGFWFRRPIFGLPGPDASSPLSRLLEQSEAFLQDDNYASARRALEFGETALKAEPEDPHAQAHYALAAYAIERRYGGYAPHVDRAKGFLDALAPAGSRDPDVRKALASRAIFEKDAAKARQELDELLSGHPDDREALALAAEADLLAKDTPGAVARFQKLLAVAPNSPRALHGLGVAKRVADPDGAAQSFAAALAADPHHTSSAVELADLALAVKHDRAAASGYVQRALAPEGIDGLGGLELARAWAIEGTLKGLEHKPIEAQKAFEAALQASSESLPARLAYGKFLVERRSYEKAVEILRPTFEAAQGDLDVVRPWVKAQLGVGRYLEASKIADGLAASRPNDAAALVLQAEVQLVTGKPKDAEKNLAAAAAKAPDAAAPLVALGRYHLSQGQLDQARDELTAAVQKAPADPATHAALGEWRLATGAVDEALASFDAAVAADPGHAAAHLGRAKALEAKGDLVGALGEYEAAKTINDVVPEHRHLLGQLLWKMAEADGTIASGELDRALEELEAAAKLEPKNARHAAHLGAVQLRSGKVDEALKTLQAAVNTDALDAEAHLWLARAALEKKDMPLAMEAIRAAIRLDDKNPAHLYQLGLILEAASNPVDALDAYKHAVELAPKDADALEHLGKTQVLLNALAEAVKSFEAALAADPARSRLLLSIGDVHLKAGQWDKAIGRFQQALKRDPALVGAYAKLGQAYDEKGDRKHAEAAYRQSIQQDPQNAVAFRQLGFAVKERYQNREAIGLFRKYLELAPDAPDKADIEDEIATLQAN